MTEQGNTRKANPIEDTNTVRPLDPNVMQSRASDPEKNVWVNASAGTGKTKVLTDRVLRLLLPDHENRAGAAPHKILCLTYTKAAASEMLVRINETLSDWAILPQSDLEQKLGKLLTRPPTNRQTKAARALFAQISNVAGGMKIMTIHAFCQSTLGRFPLEANISPQASPIEESESKALLQIALQRTILAHADDKTSPVSQALTNIATIVNDERFFTLLQDTVNERYQLAECLKTNFGLDGLYTNLCTQSGVAAGQTAKSIIAAACETSTFDQPALLSAAQTLLGSSKKTDIEKGQSIADFLAADTQTRTTLFDTYSNAFLTGDHTKILQRLATKESVDSLPSITNILTTEAQRLIAVYNATNAAESAAMTRDLLTLCAATIDQYEQLKANAGALDYNDLIIKTLDLLKNFPGWVMYKLDNGIDHILVDEAQDTNPEQWEIIEHLCSEFYDESAEETRKNGNRPRTLFIVGDDKQSIYSFQRAAPEKFEFMQTRIREKVKAAGHKWEDVQLNISFRSTNAVLAAVDSTFAPENNTPVNIKPNPQPIVHNSNRRGQAGLVELWPLFENDEDTNKERDIWAPQHTPTDSRSGSIKLAEHIAQTIKKWLDSKEILPSYNRPITPGDIMILMRTRSILVHQLMRALKNQNIPVSGADRLTLSKDIAIQDLLALALMTRCPQDDLNLACILKSPLIGLSEEELFTLAHNRKDTLWESLQTNHPALATYLAKIKTAGHLRPYEFLSFVLNAPCPASTRSGLTAFKNRLGETVTDGINELLSMAIEYEQSHIPDLGLFCDWFNRENRIIKRETEDNANHVHIMTIHGAKGLQAPIVIMPDTIITAASGNQSQAERLLWPDKTELKTPIWSPKKEYDHNTYTKARSALQIRQEREYNRLLYVAMTRAEERLYVTGHITSKKPLETSWYYKIKAGLENHPDTHPATAEDSSQALLRLHYEATNAPDYADRNKTANEQNTTDIARPDWLDKPIRTKNEKPTKLVPSRQNTTEIPITATQENHAHALTIAHARNRGIIIHKLLEILPLLPADNRYTAASSFLEKFASHLPKDERENITAQTISLLENPAYSGIFSPESLSETPVTGYLPDGRLINGIIDRLLVTPEKILIIDYKTGENIPQSPAEIPTAYKNQLHAYAQALRQIYPNRSIEAALLWTDGPVMTPVIVDEALD